ncbi:MAG TPA: hypothetical protein VML55_21850 [Planctomycetaceae bacterium]|nr:hypothetical protein [Planctomycetaceae bacterium]
MCPECVAEEATIASGPPADGADQAQVPILGSTSGQRSTDPEEPLTRASGGGTAISPEAVLVTESLRRIATHLESLSRSMRTVRWLVWGILLSSVLTVAIYGYMAWSLIETFRNPFGGLAPTGGEMDAGSAMQQMQQSQQQLQRALSDAQEFLREAEGR